jgi:hypothetical protein
MQESPIFVKTDQMVLWIVRCTQKFPKAQRFKMAKRIEDAAFAFQELIQDAATTGRPERLREADVQLALLQRRLRMARDLELISIRQFEHIAKRTAEVGRLLGAWSKRPEG